jgi:hypothetical protein
MSVHEESIDIQATPTALWHLFVDVAGWSRWDASLERFPFYVHMPIYSHLRHSRESGKPLGAYSSAASRRRL